MSAVSRAGSALLLRGPRRRVMGPMSPKRGNKNYYKGKGAKVGGRLTSTAQFRKDYTKMRFFVIPDLAGFELTPYVSRATPEVKTPPPQVTPIPEVPKDVEIPEHFCFKGNRSPGPRKPSYDAKYHHKKKLALRGGFKFTEKEIRKLERERIAREQARAQED